MSTVEPDRRSPDGFTTDFFTHPEPVLPNSARRPGNSSSHSSNRGFRRQLGHLTALTTADLQKRIGAHAPDLTCRLGHLDHPMHLHWSARCQMAHHSSALLGHMDHFESHEVRVARVGPLGRHGLSLPAVVPHAARCGPELRSTHP